MSLNQSRSEKSESQLRKPGRSGSSGQQRNFSAGGGRGGGGTAPPPSTHSSLSGNRSFKKVGNNAPGGQSRVSTTSANSESNASAKSAVQNGAHVQPPLHGVSDAPASRVPTKPTDLAPSRSTRPVPKAPASQSATTALDSVAPAAPAKVDALKTYPLQFGSFGPSFVNKMIPARTSSAPPNLDEQKRDQARHDSFKAVPTLPIPTVPKQQQSRKDVGTVNQVNSADSQPPSQGKKDVHAQVPSGPSTPATQKLSVHTVPGMPIPFQQPQVSVQFGAPNAQIQSQAPTSLQMPMQLPVGNSSQVQQQVFVSSLQSHPLQPQAMMHQGQSLSFPPQLNHQLSPQLQNLGVGIAPQFAQQQGGKFGGPRKPVKITHPETHEELSFDKRTDLYLDGGSSGPRSHPNVPPQSQPISFNPSHHINYYSPIQAGSYNSPSMYFQGQTSLPLTTNQMTPGSASARFNYPGSQGPHTVSFMNASSLVPLSTKVGPPVHGGAEISNLEHASDAHMLVSSSPPTSVQVTLKPSSGSIIEKVGSSMVSIASPVVSKGESSKLVRPPGEASSNIAQKDSDAVGNGSVQPSGSVSLPASTKYIDAASVQRPATPSTSSTTTVPPEELVSTASNTEGRRGDSVRRSDSIKDHQKKPSNKDLRHVQLLNQAGASESAGSVKSSSLKTSTEVAKHSDVMQSPRAEVVGSSTSILSLPSRSLEHSNSLKDGMPETVGGKTTFSLVETSGSASEFIQEPAVFGVNTGSYDSSEVLTDSVWIGGVSTCEPSGTSVDGTASDILDAGDNVKQDGYAVQEQGKTKLSEGPQESNNNVEMPVRSTFSGSVEVSKHFQDESFKDKETIVGDKESQSVENEQELNEDIGSISEVDRTTDNLVKSATTSSDSVAAEITSSGIVSPVVSHQDNSSSMDASIGRGESIDSQDPAFMESGNSLQDAATGPTPVSSEVTWKVEGRNTENTNGGPVLTKVSALKDKNLEPNRSKNTATRGKKKRKEILKNADAAGAISDLYNAYKGPEEKEDTALRQESIDNSVSADVKQDPVVDTEKGVVASEEDGQSKAEPDDWEDAADISTPKLKISDDRKWVRGVLVNPDDDGNEVMGKKKYSRDFLLTFSEQCTDLPGDFEIGSDIADSLMSGLLNLSHIVDRESYPPASRIVDRPSGGSRADRRGSGVGDDDKWSKSPGPFASGRDLRLDIPHGGAVVGFRPGQGGIHGVLRDPRGQPSPQYVVGILGGPLHSLAPQGGIQRNNSDSDRWQRATGIQKGLIPSPQTPSQMMHKAEKKYVVGKASDEEECKQRQLKAILNKLTPQNFDKLFEQVKEVNIDNAGTLSGVISQIFDKALMEPTFCEMYANFCFHLASALPEINEDNEKITFKRLLLNKCQEEFERGEMEQAEANRDEEEGEVKMSEVEREEKKVQARRRMLGNIRLIGELYKKKMLTERIMHECIKKLLGQDSQYQNPDEEDVEALCKLMSTIGEIIDHPKAKEHMDAYFEMMMKLSNNMKLSSRVRFMLKDAIDLRKNKWQQRRKVEGPKKIEEVHRDAAQERQAQTSRLARGSGINSSARRGQPMDFGMRGSTILPSPNAQMGGFRVMQPPVRGFGGQDVRFEDRHSYERTLSVPLPQRPIDDDSITLGPQGGLARGMSIRGQPLVSTSPMADIYPSTGDYRRMTAGPNGYNSVSEWTSHNPREDLMPRFAPDRFMRPTAYDQSNSQERNSYFGNRDLRNADRSFDRSMANSPATRVQGSAMAQNAPSEKVWPEERLREMSRSAIREYYSAKDEKEVALCIKDLNSPSFHPSMISIWVTDSFERKDMDRDSLARLLVNLTKSQDNSLNQMHLLKGFESVLATLEDAVTDAPKAAEFLGRILAKVIVEDVASLREIGRLIHEGGEERGRLLQIGLASEVFGSILESIRLEKGESLLNEICTSSNLRLEDFRTPDAIG
ncbi:eukaryotic translation initiation factor 4G-like isoform X2 [Telopea speciosissima]|uniref:eukaryotic translation initiation factor 4G-like isoform X2 n=1 Tax=Telopea speciosissima TaxID=54955 RepID=UPI001CC52951|nr:eukaryotic translation initiation factor 4G-like isoform X2 [Telopea speciosissima]